MAWATRSGVLLCFLARLFAATASEVASSEDKQVTMPKITWAQDEKEVWINVIVPEIEEHEVDLTDSSMTVEAEDSDGVKYYIALEFREFINPRDSTWKQTSSTVAITIKKREGQDHFWDRLVEYPRKFGKNIKIDFTRWKDIPDWDEDRPDENIPNSMWVLNDRTWNQTLADNDLVVVFMHYPWCVKWMKRPNAINVQSEYNQAAAKHIDPRVKFAYIDMRQNKWVAQRYGIVCEWDLEKNIRVFREGKPWKYDGEKKQEDMNKWIEFFTGPPVSNVRDDNDMDMLKAQGEVKAVLWVKDKDQPEYQLFLDVARRVRKHMFFGVVFGDRLKHHNHAGKVPAITMIKKGEFFDPVTEANVVYPGGFSDGDEMYDWVYKQQFPLLDQFNVHKEERAEAMNVAVGRFFIDEGIDNIPKGENATEKYAEVRRAADMLRGKVWFFREHTSIRGFLMEDYSLDQKRLPCLGMEFVSGAKKGNKYEYDQDAEFSAEKIVAWVDQVHAGKVKPAMRSEPLPRGDEIYAPVRKIVGKNFHQEVTLSEHDIFVEFYESWSDIHKEVGPEISQLGQALQRVTQVRVGQMDVHKNNLPPGSPFKNKDELKGKMYLVPADKKHKPIPFDDIPTAKAMLTFIYKRASVRFNYNEIYGKIVNYKFEQKEKKLTEMERKKEQEDKDEYEEDEL